MIPDFNTDGVLPAGIHWAEWDEITTRFGYTRYRQELLFGMMMGIDSLRRAGCKAVYIDGSFCTSKISPSDFDICYDDTGLDWTLLYNIDPTILDFQDGRRAQKAKFKGEFFPYNILADSTRVYFDFFQIDKHTSKPKGIVGLKL